MREGAASQGAPGVATRNAGYVACLIGVLVMLSGRFVAGAPVLAIYVGIGIIAFGWGLFAYSIYQRVMFARAHTAPGGS